MIQADAVRYFFVKVIATVFTSEGKMKFRTADVFHTHTRYCDGKGTISDYIISLHKLNIKKVMMREGGQWKSKPLM